MIETIAFHIKHLEDMEKYPKIFYLGNSNLLQKKDYQCRDQKNPI